MRRTPLFLTALVAAVGMTSAFAVSDGTYDPASMHCSPAANGGDGDRVEDGCHNATVTVSDVGGHEYFGIGTQQTALDDQGPVPGVLPFGLFSNVHTLDVWYDGGSGCTRHTLDLASPDQMGTDACPWLAPGAPNYYPRFAAAPNPASGLRIYFGLDDNTAGGEHDSSDKISNGPSDGGGARVVLDPASVEPWLEAFIAANPQYIATHPLPAGDAGVGFCADSICFSIQTQRQVAYQGGSDDPNKHRDAANYHGKRWDPTTCSGESDTPQRCDDPVEPGDQDLTYWHNKEGTVYVQPGVQIYADPDPQGSPIGPYPIPALYIGTCGVIIGGGPMAPMPASPFTDPATNQVVIATACG